MGLFSLSLSPVLEAKILELVDALTANAREQAKLAGLRYQAERRLFRRNIVHASLVTREIEPGTSPSQGEEIVNKELRINKELEIVLTGKDANGNPEPIEGPEFKINGVTVVPGTTEVSPYGQLTVDTLTPARAVYRALNVSNGAHDTIAATADGAEGERVVPIELADNVNVFTVHPDATTLEATVTELP
jgi:hypothetical protein